MSEPALGSPGHVVFRPEDLGRFPGKDKLPVMAWGDDGCAINRARYLERILTADRHLADVCPILSRALLPLVTWPPHRSRSCALSR
jgi:hypothetical protein